MTDERAMEILDPNHREHYESIEPVNEACRIGMKAIKRVKELEAENLRLKQQLNNKIDEKECDKIYKIVVYLVEKYQEELLKEFNIDKDSKNSFFQICEVFDKIYEEMNKKYPLMWHQYGFGSKN